jgi:hypothetical protein
MKSVMEWLEVKIEEPVDMIIQYDENGEEYIVQDRMY